MSGEKDQHNHRYVYDNPEEAIEDPYETSPTAAFLAALAKNTNESALEETYIKQMNPRK